MASVVAKGFGQRARQHSGVRPKTQVVGVVEKRKAKERAPSPSRTVGETRYETASL